MLEILHPSRWHELAEVFAKEFDAELPQPDSTILANIEDGKITGFVVVEWLGRIGQIWNTGRESRGMLDWFDKGMPRGQSIIAIASEPRFEGLCQMYGMRHVKGSVYRKDF